MTKKLQVYKCDICGNIVEILNPGKGELMCCGKKMTLMVEKDVSSEGKEKHVPVVKKTEDGYIINVGSIDHPMTEEHYIMWIDVFTTENMFRKCFFPGDKPQLRIRTSDDILEVRAYCNIHGLWKYENDIVKIINVADYDKSELILMALKSEIESENVYRELSKKVDNAFLKVKLNFLADEEKKHKEYFELFFKETFPGKPMKLPEQDFAPLPLINMTGKDVPASDILKNAKKSEKAAHDFYMELSKLFPENIKLSNMLSFFASMEMIHYAILDEELRNIERDEDYLIEWPMIHVGP